MGTVTYPTPEVAALLYERFVPVRVDATESPATAEDFGVRITPTLVVLDSDGTELRRWSGFVDAGELSAGLQLADARRRLEAGDTQGVEDALSDVLFRDLPPSIAAEALFFLGQVLARTGAPAAARGPWQELVSKYPRSRWAAEARRRLEE